MEPSFTGHAYNSPQQDSMDHSTATGTHKECIVSMQHRLAANSCHQQLLPDIKRVQQQASDTNPDKNPKPSFAGHA
jgi:hypothetical protein